MNAHKYQWIAIAAVLALTMTAGDALARRGGGGGGRGGGGGGRSSFSGGSVRYSSPSRTSSSYSRSSSSYSRSSSPSYSRSSTPSYSRSSTPTYSRSTPSYSSGVSQRPASPSYRPGSSIGSGTTARPSTPIYRPPSSGSIIHSGSVTTPRGSTISGAVGPRGNGAIGIQGAGGTNAGAIRGPAGGSAAGIRGPEGGAAGAVRGPNGGAAAGIRGPEGGAVGGVRGPNGGAAAGVRGPNGGAAGAVRGPYGGGAAGVRGPWGGGAGAVWGPGGYGVAGVRGPYGHGVYTTLPAGAIHYPWHGGDYWHFGFSWYTPCWVGDSVYYNWAYPPIGFYYSSLPAEYETTVINNTTYYESEGVYYVEGEKDGQNGYVVAENPMPEATTTQPSEAIVEGVNPFQVLKTMCDQMAGMNTFSVVASTTVDQLGEDGSTAQLSVKRVLSVQRPDQIAVDVTGDNGSKRFVYDGKKAYLYDASKNTSVSAEMPNTIEAALEKLAKDYKVVLPLEDLMYKDLYERSVAGITAGQYLGKPTVGGYPCHHIAFTTNDAEWELWIDAGDKPFPRKASVSYKQDLIRVRQTADLTEWNPAPSFSTQTFQFNAPASAIGVELTKAAQ